MSRELSNLISKTFIARADVKAIQYPNGYTPHVADKKHPEETRIPWRREDIEAHLDGKQSFGHYMVNKKDECKLFAFDIDLEKAGFLPVMPHPALADPWFTEKDLDKYEKSFVEVNNLREAWLHRAHPGRPLMKRQFHYVAQMFCKAIHEELELPCAASYSGNKGIHVYAFTGVISAHQARKGAKIILDTLGKFEPIHGDNFFRFTDRDPVNGFPNLSIEVFPKQDSLAGKDLGNLMRLPLGRNLKNPKDPTFFLDLTAPLADLRPVDPIWAITDGAANPWQRQGE